MADVTDEREVLPEPVWRARRAAHEARVDALVAPHLARRAAGEKHPVHDFLFGYYSYRPAQLRRWHPGLGVVCLGRPSDAVSAARPEPALVESIRRLLSATASRPPQLGCFGLHEWAMVHRASPDRVRHAAYPLRLGPTGTDEVVESHRIACSHFDAYRFFTPSARPLNLLQPRAEDRVDLEQPGCLHAGMDLYKHAFRLWPLVSSELVADCFELARDIRELDMRASPYDLSGLGYEPVRIETAAGKQEYAAAQRVFAERGAPLRARLVKVCERVAAAELHHELAHAPDRPAP